MLPNRSAGDSDARSLATCINLPHFNRYNALAAEAWQDGSELRSREQERVCYSLLA